MTALVCLSLADAQTYQSQVAAALGYPKQGVKCGGGITVNGPTALSAMIIAHPTLAQWAYCSVQIATPSIIFPPAGATWQILDATWFTQPNVVG